VYIYANNVLVLSICDTYLRGVFGVARFRQGGQFSGASECGASKCAELHAFFVFLCERGIVKISQ
jgi:hypothetical protein